MDEIVSSVYFEGEVFIFTKRGEVFKMVKNAYTGSVEFQHVATLPVR